jgi:hypothetical protein
MKKPSFFKSSSAKAYPDGIFYQSDIKLIQGKVSEKKGLILFELIIQGFREIREFIIKGR